MAIKGTKEQQVDSIRFTKKASSGVGKTTSLLVGNRAQRNRGKRARE